MKRFALLAILFACIGRVDGDTSAPSLQNHPVLSSTLATLAVRGKVDAVLWAQRRNSCTLQVMMSKLRDPAAVWPKISIWLLRSDGQIIEPTQRWDSPVTAKPCLRCIGSMVQYSFPVSASTDAVAAVLRVDDDYRVQRLTLLNE